MKRSDNSLNERPKFMLTTLIYCYRGNLSSLKSFIVLLKACNYTTCSSQSLTRHEDFRRYAVNYKHVHKDTKMFDKRNT